MLWLPLSLSGGFFSFSNDKDRIEEARDELHKVANEREVKNAPILVFANKQDVSKVRAVVMACSHWGVRSYPDLLCPTAPRAPKHSYSVSLLKRSKRSSCLGNWVTSTKYKVCYFGENTCVFGVGAAQVLFVKSP